MLQPQRHPTVFEARIALEDAVARYFRLCIRWEHTFHLSNIRCIEMALQSLPHHLEEDIRAFYGEPDWDTLWKRAESREERIKFQSTYLAFPAYNPLIHENDFNMTQQQPPTTSIIVPRRGPPSPCPSCYENHWKKDCPHKKTRCFSCHASAMSVRLVAILL